MVMTWPSYKTNALLHQETQLIPCVLLILFFCHYINCIQFGRLHIGASSEPEPEWEPEPEPEPEPEWEPEPEPEPKPKPKRYRSHTTEPPKDFSIGSPGLSLKFDLPSLKIQVPAVKLPGISLKATIKKPGLGLRLFPLNIKLPRLNLATGIGGHFGFSSGGKSGLKITSDDWMMMNRRSRCLQLYDF